MWLIVVCCGCLQHGLNAVSMTIAEQYIAAFSNLAKETNTVLLPASSGDVSSMVSQVGIHPDTLYLLQLHFRGGGLHERH